MSTEVDNRIVEMQFENSRFERNVSTTMSTLDKLKEKLNFSGVSRGMGELSSAAGKVNLSPLSDSIASVASRFSILEITGITALANIANSAVNAGKQMLSALTLQPVKTGFDEYELKMNSVLTIMASTGEELSDVNEYLEQLNRYADQTIYSFSDMTRNIGKFTNAGVSLDDAVAAIKGISNEAALSGANANEASRAMYNFAQALSAGYVKLIDWKSIEYANMATKGFKDELIKTAVELGTVKEAADGMYRTLGGTEFNSTKMFNEVLQDKWLTSDVLITTLKKYSDTTTEIGQKATAAATEVKTVSQLWGTLKEAAQSGWAQSWEIIIGDLDEAKALLTRISDVIGGLIGVSADARNGLLKGWKEAGGRDELIESFKMLYDVLKQIGIVAKDTFQEMFPPLTVETLLKFTTGLRNLVSKLQPSAEVLDKIRRTLKGLFAGLQIGWDIFVATFQLAAPLLIGVAGAVLDISAALGDLLVKLNDYLKKSNFFTKTVATIKAGMAPLVEWIERFAVALAEGFSGVDIAADRLKPLGVIATLVKTSLIAVGNVVNKMTPFLEKAAAALGAAMREVFNVMADPLNSENPDTAFGLFSGGIMAAIGVFIAKMFKSGSGIVDGIKGIVQNIRDIFEGVGDAIGAFTDSIKADTLKKIATAIAILAAALLVIAFIDSEKLATSLTAVTVMFAELMGAMAIFTKIVDGKGVLRITMTAKVLTTLAKSLLILAVAMKILSTMSLDEMGIALIAFTVGLAGLLVAVNLLPKEKVNRAARAIQTLATSMLILAAALKIMSSMSWEEMGIALISMAVGLAAMVAALKLVPADAGKRAAGLLALSIAMVIIGAALKIMGSMSWEEMAIGLTALAVSLVILAGAMQLMKGCIGGAFAMLIIAPALLLLAAALKIMGTMTWDDIARGLIVLAGSLIIVAGAMDLMKGAIAGAASLLIVAAALVVMASAIMLLVPSMLLLGTMSWEEIGKGLAVIGGALAILGIAGYALGSVAPTIVALAGAVALLGLGCALVGTGVMALGAGLKLIASAGEGAADVLIAFIAGVISLIPHFVEQVGVGIVNFIELIANSASAIAKAIADIIVAIVDGLVTAVPALVEGFLVLLTSTLESLATYLPQIISLLIPLLIQTCNLLAQHMPVLVESLVTLLVSLLDALAANVGRLMEPLLNLLTVIVQGLSDILGPLVETVVAPILEILTELFVGLAEALGPYIPDIMDMIERVTELVVESLELLEPTIRATIDLIDEFGETTVSIMKATAEIMRITADTIEIALTGLADIFKTTCEGISLILTSTGETIDTILSGTAATIDSTANLIGTSLGGLDDIFETTFTGISDIITSVGDSIKSVLDGIAGVIESIGTAALNTGTGFEKLAEGVKTITKLNLVDMTASLGALSIELSSLAISASGIKDVGTGMDKLVRGITSIADGFKSASTNGQIMVAILLSINRTMFALASSFTVVGTTMVTNLLRGINSTKDTLSTAATTMIESVIDAIESTYWDFYDAGEYVVDGLSAGITDRTWYAEAKAAAMAKAALEAAEEALDVNSPSREFYKVGSFAGKGFVNAFIDYETIAFAAGSRMAKAAQDGLTDIASRISDVIDGNIDVQPVIRPVLDLSEVRSGAGAIGGMLGLNPSIGVLSTAGSISASMNARIQNGFNDDVISAINNLGKNLGKTGNNYYTVEGVTYDDGSNIADAVRSIARAAIRERRV